MRQHNIQEPEQCSDDSDSEPEDAMDQSVSNMLNYDEKIAELKRLEEEFTNKLKDQNKQLKMVVKDIKQEQLNLKERV